MAGVNLAPLPLCVGLLAAMTLVAKAQNQTVPPPPFMVPPPSPNVLHREGVVVSPPPVHREGVVVTPPPANPRREGNPDASKPERTKTAGSSEQPGPTVPQSFWTTTTGLITALAGFITAVAALMAALRRAK